MELKPGKNTSEFKVVAATNIINALIPLLVIYGLLNTEEAQLWQGFLAAVIVIIIPVATAMTTKEYTRGRTALKLSALNNAARGALSNDAPTD